MRALSAIVVVVLGAVLGCKTTICDSSDIWPPPDDVVYFEIPDAPAAEPPSGAQQEFAPKK